MIGLIRTGWPASSLDDARSLVAHHHRIAHAGVRPGVDPEVGVADRGRGHPHHDVVRPRGRLRPADESELPRRLEHRGSRARHRSPPLAG
jgi:hypothetical protein